jgi:hypothetical protein
MEITPYVKVETPDRHRRCYCCYGEATVELTIGHRTERGGNSHAISLCDECRELVSRTVANG